MPVKKRIYNKSTGRDYVYDTAYQASPEQKKRRAARNKDRRAALRSGVVKKGSSMDVDHKDNNPRNHKASNKQIISRSKNRAKK
jgi:hypothetical protein